MWFTWLLCEWNAAAVCDGVFGDVSGEGERGHSSGGDGGRGFLVAVCRSAGAAEDEDRVLS